MGFTTIYRSQDSTEISIIRQLFEDNEIEFQVLEKSTYDATGITSSVNQGMSVQVEEDQVEDAKTVLLENGFLGNWSKGRVKRQRLKFSKWVFLFLAALVLIIVAFLIMWFMNP